MNTRGSDEAKNRHISSLLLDEECLLVYWLKDFFASILRMYDPAVKNCSNRALTFRTFLTSN